MLLQTHLNLAITLGIRIVCKAIFFMIYWTICLSSGNVASIGSATGKSRIIASYEYWQKRTTRDFQSGTKAESAGMTVDRKGKAEENRAKTSLETELHFYTRKSVLKSRRNSNALFACVWLFFILIGQSLRNRDYHTINT